MFDSIEDILYNADEETRLAWAQTILDMSHWKKFEDEA